MVRDESGVNHDQRSKESQPITEKLVTMHAVSLGYNEQIWPVPSCLLYNWTLI